MIIASTKGFKILLSIAKTNPQYFDKLKADCTKENIGADIEMADLIANIEQQPDKPAYLGYVARRFTRLGPSLDPETIINIRDTFNRYERYNDTIIPAINDEIAIIEQERIDQQPQPTTTTGILSSSPGSTTDTDRRNRYDGYEYPPLNCSPPVNYLGSVSDAVNSLQEPMQKANSTTTPAWDVTSSIFWPSINMSMNTFNRMYTSTQQLIMHAAMGVQRTFRQVASVFIPAEQIQYEKAAPLRTSQVEPKGWYLMPDTISKAAAETAKPRIIDLLNCNYGDLSRVINYYKQYNPYNYTQNLQRVENYSIPLTVPNSANLPIEQQKESTFPLTIQGIPKNQYPSTRTTDEVLGEVQK